MAIKGVIITLLVILIIWILYKFNISVPIPRLNIRLPEQKTLPRKNSRANKPSPVASKKADLTYESYKAQMEKEQRKYNTSNQGQERVNRESVKS